MRPRAGSLAFFHYTADAKRQSLTARWDRRMIWAGVRGGVRHEVLENVLVIAAAVVVAVAIYAGVAGAVGSRQDPVGWQRMMVTSRASGTPQPGVCRALMNDPKAL